MCLCCALVPASDEEEGPVLFDNSGKVAADPFDTSSGSVQLIAIKPAALPVVHPTSDRSQETSAVLNGEVSTRPPCAEGVARAQGFGVKGTEVTSASRGRFCLCACQASMADAFRAFSAFSESPEGAF